MSLIGGHFSTDGKLATAVLEERVADHSILASDRVEDYDNEVIETEFGHVISKYKKGYAHRLPTVADGQGNVLMVSGYLFPPVPDGPDQCARLLDLCVETGGSAIEASEGEFVCVFVDGRSGTLHIVNDRFGACPFFTLQVDKRTYFSSNLAFLCCLASGRREPDVLGCLQIFSYGHTLGTRTHMQGVKRLLPASHMTCSRGGILQKQYWHLRHQVEDHLNPEAFADELFDAFKRGTDRRTRMLSGGIIALSGGVDSRLMAGAVPKDAPFSAFTYVDSVDTTDTPEVRAAAQVAKALHLEHRIERFPQQALSSIASEITSLAGGLVPLHHPSQVMQCIAAMKDTPGCMLAARPGGSLAGSIIPSPIYLDPARTSQCMRSFCRNRKCGQGHAAALLGLVFRQDILKAHYAQLDECLLETLGTLEGPTAGHVVTAWSMVYRQPAFSFASPVYSHPDVTEVTPHLCYEYVDLMLRLPAQWIYKKNFYNYMVYRCLPDLRHVAYSNTGRPLPGRVQDVPLADGEYWPGYRLYLGMRDVVRRAVPAWLIPSPSWIAFHYRLWRENEDMLDTTADIINSRSSLRTIFDVDRCNVFLDDFRSGRIHCGGPTDDAELVGALATICNVFEFFDM